MAKNYTDNVPMVRRAWVCMRCPQQVSKEGALCRDCRAGDPQYRILVLRNEARRKRLIDKSVSV